MCYLLCLIIEILYILRLKKQIYIYIAILICAYFSLKLLQIVATYIYNRREGEIFNFVGILRRVYSDICCSAKRMVPVALGLLIGLLFIPEKDIIQVPDALSLAEEDAKSWEELKNSVLNKLCLYGDMDKAGRLELAQDIVNYELDYLGVNEEIKLVAETYKAEEQCGVYRHGAKEISVKEALIEGDDIEQLLYTIFHECYHAYQCYCIDVLAEHGNVDYSLRMNKQLLMWKYETGNYKTVANNGYDEYASQNLERDANSYAKVELEKYRMFLGE